MRKEHQTVATVGDLLDYIKDVPRDTPIGRLTNGYFKVNKTGDVSVLLGELPIGHPGKEVQQVILRIDA